MDGSYFQRDGTVVKLVTTLKGPSTLLSNSKQKDIRKKINNMQSTVKLRKLRSELQEMKNENNGEVALIQQKIRLETLELRKKMGDILDKKSINSMKNGEAAIYTVGNDKIGCIHSEPPINVDRLFMSILPCTVSEINELKKRWKI